MLPLRSPPPPGATGGEKRDDVLPIAAVVADESPGKTVRRASPSHRIQDGVVRTMSSTSTDGCRAANVLGDDTM